MKYSVKEKVSPLFSRELVFISYVLHILNWYQNRLGLVSIRF